MSADAAVAALVLLSAVSLILTFVGHAAVRRVLSRPTPAGGGAPPISILKPLKGLDEGLFENLASFARQRYPEFEILLGVPAEDDPALEVADRLRRAFPEVAVSVHVCPTRLGRNPKVNTLAALSGLARYEHLLVSDSNVRVRADYLRATAAELSRRGVGLVTNPVVGVGERTVAALFENLHLNSFVVAGVCGAQLLTRHACVLGKSMLFRRRDLLALGGWRPVRHVLAEDYALGRRFEAAGFRVALSPHVVTTVNETWSVRLFAGRHLRWAQMRRRISPATYIGEPLLNPAVWLAMLLAASAAGASLGPISSGRLGAAAVAGLAAKVVSDALLLRGLRGEAARWADLAWVPVKDAIIAGLWVVAAFRRTVHWRGSALRIGPGSRLLRPRRVRDRAGEAARAGAAEVAD